MSVSLADIKKNVMGPPRLLIYGVPGIGKTTLAASIPNSIWIPAEDGLAGLEVDAFPKPTTLEEVFDCVQALLDEEHSYDWLVVDSLTEIGALGEDFVCRTVPHEKGKEIKNIEDYGYFKGPRTHVPNAWREFRAGLEACRNAGMGICLVGHNVVEKFDDPESEPYDRHQLAISRYAEPIVYDWCDAVLFLNYHVTAVERQGSDRRRGVGTGERSIYTANRPAFRAKNRFNLPFEIKLPENGADEAWSIIDEHIGITAGAKPKPTKTAKPGSRKAKAKAGAAT